jgi:hypothetical protein
MFRNALSAGIIAKSTTLLFALPRLQTESKSASLSREFEERFGEGAFVKQSVFNADFAIHFKPRFASRLFFGLG